MCTLPLPFDRELDLWAELGVRQVGLSKLKLNGLCRDHIASALEDRSLRATTVSTGRNFDLSAPETWGATRGWINEAVDLAGIVGGCVYFTPGRRDGRSFDELTASLAEAVEPCVEYARSRNVRLAMEPSLRTDLSFVHGLADGLDVAERVGIDVVADLGNCWVERDYEKAVLRAGDRIAMVQFADAIYGTPGELPPGGRAVPGDGDLRIDRFLQAALDAGYTGAFELELVGPLIEAEGHEAALLRGVERANELPESL